LRGEEGAQCGYEKPLIEQRADAQRNAIEKIRREYSETEVATDLNMSVSDLRKGAAFIQRANCLPRSFHFAGGKPRGRATQWPRKPSDRLWQSGHTPNR
jgi:hypothetical protein